MREIKFRAFDAVGDKGWVYGDLVHYQMVTVDGLEPRVMVGGYEVDPESICQYTGLKDEIGRDVYEGDIIKIDGSDELPRVVIFYEHAFVIATAEEFGYLEHGEHPYLNDYAHMMCLNEWSNTGLVRVIGNIIDTPELLKTR